MSNPTAALFQAGTQFARSINAMPSKLTDGMTANASNYPSGAMSNPFGMGGSFKYDEARRPNLGAYDQTNFSVLLDPERWVQYRATEKQIAFISRGDRINDSTHDARGVSSMNQLFNAQEGRQLYGADCTGNRMDDDWNLYGAPTTNTPEELQQFDYKAQGFHVGRRAKIWNICSALRHTDGDPSLQKSDHVYILARRFQVEDQLARRFGTIAAAASSSGGRSLPVAPTGSMSVSDEDGYQILGVNPFAGATGSVAEPPHYWVLTPWVSRDRRPPASWMYQTPNGRGRRMFVGTVYEVYGSTYFSKEVTTAARTALFPIRDTPEYLTTGAIKSGLDMDVQIGLRG